MIIIKESHGNRKVFTHINNWDKKMKRGLRSAFIEIGREHVKHARLLIMSPPKTGDWYYSKIKPSPHQASDGEAGEAPANWTGLLKKNVKYKVRGWSEMEFGVDEDVIYAKWLELGTKRMVERPFLVRTIREKQKDTMNSFEKGISRGMKL